MDHEASGSPPHLHSTEEKGLEREGQRVGPGCHAVVSTPREGGQAARWRAPGPSLLPGLGSFSSENSGYTAGRVRRVRSSWFRRQGVKKIAPAGSLQCVFLEVNAISPFNIC